MESMRDFSRSFVVAAHSHSAMFEYEFLDADVQKKLKCPTFKKYVQVTCGAKSPLVVDWQISDKSSVMGERYYKFAEKIRNFKVREDDVWILSYPKCGTTWTQEMVWMLANNLDYETAKKIDISNRSPILELATFVPFINSLKSIDKMPGPRFIKSHLPLNLLPIDLWQKNPRIVYVARNPKDAAISYYHHYRGINGYKGTFEDFLDGFMNGHVLYGSYFEHVHDFYQVAKLKPNLYFNTYEEMKFNMPDVLKKVSVFLGKHYSDEQLRRLDEHLKFDNMRQLDKSNMSKTVKFANVALVRFNNNFKFMRKGQVGSFKEEMPERYIQRFDERAQKYNGIHNFHENWMLRHHV